MPHVAETASTDPDPVIRSIVLSNGYGLSESTKARLMRDPHIVRLDQMRAADRAS